MKLSRVVRQMHKSLLLTTQDKNVASHSEYCSGWGPAIAQDIAEEDADRGFDQRPYLVGQDSARNWLAASAIRSAGLSTQTTGLIREISCQG